MSEQELREYCRQASLDISNMQNQITKLQQENKKYKEVISNIKNFIEELYDNTDDTTCYDIDINTKQDILDILKEVD